MAALSLQGVEQNTACDVTLCNYTLPPDCIVNTVSDYKVIAQLLVWMQSLSETCVLNKCPTLENAVKIEVQ